MRLIDADALIMDYITDDAENDSEIISRNDILNAPTVDAVEVVRCADCRYFICNLRPDGYLPEGVGETECTLFHFGADYTDFCSRGERSTE